MKTNQQLKTFQQELDYLDYLVTVVRRPYNRGVLKSVNRKIKDLKKFIETASRNPTDIETLEHAKTILEKFLDLKQKYFLIHTKK